MKKILMLLSSIILTFNYINLQAQEIVIKPWNYNIKIELKDTTIWINLIIKGIKTENRGNYLLFNRYIKIDEAKLDDKPLKYTRRNDTLYLESSIINEMTLSMQYKIPCTASESSKIIKSYGDSIYSYSALFDTNQIFLERFNKWYPVIYDNFSNYYVSITVPQEYKVFAYYHETNYENSNYKHIYSYNHLDEDFPFLITKSKIFQSPKVIQYDNTYFEFNFLPQKTRLLSIMGNKPIYTNNSKQLDSLYNVIVNRSIKALEWYNDNLWQQQIDTLRFVETKIFRLGVCMNNFILVDRSLMNMEVLDNFAFSHEIGHLWLGIHTEYLAKGKYFLGESINEYINLLYYENWAGESAFKNAIQDKINMKYSDEPFFTVSFEQVLNQRNGKFQYELIYSKGIIFIHEFRKMIGKDKLLKIIRETYSIPNHFVTLKDFERSIKENGCWDKYLKLYELKL